MFVVLLRFSSNKADARVHMDGHKAWLDRGFEDGVFLLSGGIRPSEGGAILARAESLAELQHWVDADPFVANGVVDAEIIEIAPNRADEKLQFLLA